MNIYTCLKEDHEQLKSLLAELEKLDQEDEFRFVLLEQIKQELVPHARAEESVLYNSMRAVPTDNSEVMHGFKEHAEAEALLRTLLVKDKINLDWKETAVKLREALEHHIEEEETEIFKEAQRMFTQEEAEMMGDAFLKLKADVKERGFFKGSLEIIINLMPPRFINQLKGISSSDNA